METNKFNNLSAYFAASMYTREDIKDMILRASLNLLMECSTNFDGNARMTEQTAQPLFFLNEILDKVE